MDKNDEHFFTFRLRKCDGRSVSDGTTAEAVEVLRPRHKKRSPHKMYTESESFDDLKLSLNTSFYVLNEDFPYIRVSLRTGGLCHLCFL